MAIDDDIARPLPDGVLPEPPPPNPARREAAIDAALRRFDGVPARPRSGLTPEPPWWTRLGRPQLGALVSAALIAVIGMPVAMISLGDPDSPMSMAPPPPNTPAAGATVPVAAPSPVAAIPSAAPTPVAPPALAQTPPVATPAMRADNAAMSCEAGDCAAGDQPAAPAMKAARDEVLAAQGGRAERTDRPGVAARARLAENGTAPSPVVVAPLASPPPAPPPPPAEMAAEASASEIVVTGMRRAAPARSTGRGDWNACTVNDPNRSLAACRKLVDPGAKGSAGRAAAHLADGLSRAWRGDLDGAIAAFDQAIAIDPRQSLAYLNRGLAYQRNGDLDRAIADLDRAVTYARGSARAYYNRSVLLRQRGDTRRASADEDRAVSLDLRYQAVVR